MDGNVFFALHHQFKSNYVFFFKKSVIFRLSIELEVRNRQLQLDSPQTDIYSMFDMFVFVAAKTNFNQEKTKKKKKKKEKTKSK